MRKEIVIFDDIEIKKHKIHQMITQFPYVM